MDFNSEFRKQFRPGSRWLRTNHVNPKPQLREPVEVTVIKTTPQEAIVGHPNGDGFYLTWPHKAGLKATPVGDGWHIKDAEGRTLVSYAPLTPIPELQVDVGPSPIPESLLHEMKAALRWNGNIYTGSTHSSAIINAFNSGAFPDYKIWEDVMDATLDMEESFLTNAGRFLDREAAYTYAKHRQRVKTNQFQGTAEFDRELHAPDMESLASRIVNTLLEDVEEDLSWVGVDFDGTLATHKEYKGPTKLGQPIPKMVARVRRWVSHGKKVKIFTARADDEKSVNAIKKWLKDNELPDLEVTNLKDKYMTALWDDKAVSVKRNTGEVKESGESPEQLLELLDEARYQLMDMWNVADDSVADYALQIQTTVNFIEKALQTQDRLDIFRALTKARDALKVEYDETGEDEEYNDLVDRLSASLQESQGNAIVHFLLTESPEIKTLKDHAVKLTPEERTQVMKAGAVWHHGPSGEESPAVRKAVINGKTWYWCATHRAGRVAKSLEKSIRDFKWVKTTS